MAESPNTGELVRRSDEDLWLEFASGTDAAIEVLADRYRDDVFWYLLLSMGKQDAAARASRQVWATLASYRHPHEGFSSFRSWLYAVATQNAVPATHPEPFGLADLIDDVKRAPQTTRRGRVFYAIADMTRAVRQPFLLVTLVGLSVADAATACNFTERKTWLALGKAYARLSRTGLFGPAGDGDGV